MKILLVKRKGVVERTRNITNSAVNSYSIKAMETVKKAIIPYCSAKKGGMTHLADSEGVQHGVHPFSPEYEE